MVLLFSYLSVSTGFIDSSGQLQVESGGLVVLLERNKWLSLSEGSREGYRGRYFHVEYLVTPQLSSPPDDARGVRGGPSDHGRQDPQDLEVRVVSGPYDVLDET